ncbi:uncharacterized protein EV422DRAFT_194187 [Fimicolochytrium jonesii]|uniref:uncharacterized protein n=1 Tax=Fimicolochytrium jonesii TaxID=1396493 RepID=UPI0022FEB7AE|nr:uncharacterized protein EV422DRAFT_194187 [Fimicolochytrium jonesii]KAI8818201.1 hypothetical protein EV422DRAFT_194187 [Fimicolochytrium jonesii]
MLATGRITARSPPVPFCPPPFLVWCMDPFFVWAMDARGKKARRVWWTSKASILLCHYRSSHHDSTMTFKNLVLPRKGCPFVGGVQLFGTESRRVGVAVRARFSDPWWPCANKHVHISVECAHIQSSVGMEDETMKHSHISPRMCIFSSPNRMSVRSSPISQNGWTFALPRPLGARCEMDCSAALGMHRSTLDIPSAVSQDRCETARHDLCVNQMQQAREAVADLLFGCADVARESSSTCFIPIGGLCIAPEQYHARGSDTAPTEKRAHSMGFPKRGQLCAGHYTIEGFQTTYLIPSHARGWGEAFRRRRQEC